MLAGDVSILKHVGVDVICDMIRYRNNQREDRKLWELYLTKYQHMDKTNFIPFEEFFKKPESEEVAKKTDDEIIEDAYRIRQNLGKLN